MKQKVQYPVSLQNEHSSYLPATLFCKKNMTKKKNKKGFCRNLQNNNVVGCSFGFYITKGELI